MAMTQGISATQAFFPRQPIVRTGNVFADAPIQRTGFDPIDRPYFQPTGQMGYGLDLNRDGKFNPQKDGYLAFDLNRDGRYTDHEVQQSRNILKAFSGDFDQNADGRLDWNEMFQGYQNYWQARHMDVDQDGVLSKWELQRAGAGVVQRDSITGLGRGPVTDVWRNLGLDNLPGKQSLEYVNPWNRTFGTSGPGYFSGPYLPAQPPIARFA